MKKVVKHDFESGKTVEFKTSRKRVDPDTLPYNGKVTKHFGLVDIVKFHRKGK